MAVRVSADPREVAAVRAAADAEADALVPAALALVRAGRYPTPEQDHALRHRRASAAPELRAVADDDAAAPGVRVVAAVTLSGIGDPGGAARAAAFLADPSRDLRVETVTRLNNHEVGDIDWSVPGSADALCRLIGDADEHVGRVAANLAALHKVAGADAAVVARLDRGPVRDRAAWAGALSGVARTPAAAVRAARELFRDPPERYWVPSLMYNLHWVNHHRDPAVREAARAEARAFCRRYLAAGHTNELVTDFALIAGPEDVPLLEAIAATSRSKGIRSLVHAALARLDPARAVARVLPHARRPLDQWYLNVFSDHATEADAARVIPLVRPTKRELAGFDPLLEQVVRLLARLGEPGRAELRTWLDRLSGNLRTRVEWVLHGVTLRPVLDALAAAGALPGDVDALMAQLRGCTADNRELDEGDPGLVAQAFGWAGRAVSFDVGCGPVVQDRDRLRLFTAERTGGLFVPECVVAEEHGPDPDSPATVRFVHGGRAFAFDTTVAGDYADISAVTAAANAALAAAGAAERFLELPPDGCGPVLILTDPAKYRPVAARFHLPAPDPAW